MMMKATIAVVALAACVAVVLGDSTNPLCDPSYECKFKYTSDANEIYNYDFSSLCSNTDWVVQDSVRHNYYANICGYAKQNCLPLGWTNNYEFGVTVQMWGSTPTCQDRCTTTRSGSPQPACCTADCQVLGREAPMWSLMDPSNPETGGVIAAFKGASPKDSDPFWCTFNPATGAQYEREVHYHFMCDETVDTVTPVSAQQNSTNDCRYTIEWRTAFACSGNANAASAGGWIFVLIVLILAFVYIVGGIIFGYVTRKEIAFPNVAFWGYFAGLMKDGLMFLAHGCKKGGNTNPGAYDEIGSTPAATTGSNSATFQANAAYTATGGDASPRRDYTDL